MIFRTLLLTAALMATINLCSQNQAALNYGVQTQTVLSYTGWRQNINFEFAVNKNRFYLGPGLSISDAYMPAKTSFGWQAGYNRVFEHEKNWITTAGVHFQAFYGADRVQVRPQTYEAFFNYGLGYQTGKFQIINTLGFGGYLERFYNTGFGEIQMQEGYNFMLNLTVGYTF